MKRIEDDCDPRELTHLVHVQEGNVVIWKAKYPDGTETVLSRKENKSNVV